MSWLDGMNALLSVVAIGSSMPNQQNEQYSASLAIYAGENVDQEDTRQSDQRDSNLQNLELINELINKGILAPNTSQLDLLLTTAESCKLGQTIVFLGTFVGVGRNTVEIDPLIVACGTLSSTGLLTRTDEIMLPTELVQNTIVQSGQTLNPLSYGVANPSDLFLNKTVKQKLPILTFSISQDGEVAYAVADPTTFHAYQTAEEYIDSFVENLSKYGACAYQPTAIVNERIGCKEYYINFNFNGTDYEIRFAVNSFGSADISNQISTIAFDALPESMRDGVTELVGDRTQVNSQNSGIEITLMPRNVNSKGEKVTVSGFNQTGQYNLTSITATPLSEIKSSKEVKGSNSLVYILVATVLAGTVAGTKKLVSRRRKDKEVETISSDDITAYAETAWGIYKLDSIQTVEQLVDIGRNLCHLSKFVVKPESPIRNKVASILSDYFNAEYRETTAQEFSVHQNAFAEKMNKVFGFTLSDLASGSNIFHKIAVDYFRQYHATVEGGGARLEEYNAARQTFLKHYKALESAIPILGNATRKVEVQEAPRYFCGIIDNTKEKASIIMDKLSLDDAFSKLILQLGGGRDDRRLVNSEIRDIVHAMLEDTGNFESTRSVLATKSNRAELEGRGFTNDQIVISYTPNHKNPSKIIFIQVDVKTKDFEISIEPFKPASEKSDNSGLDKINKHKVEFIITQSVEEKIAQEISILEHDVVELIGNFKTEARVEIAQQIQYINNYSISKALLQTMIAKKIASREDHTTLPVTFVGFSHDNLQQVIEQHSLKVASNILDFLSFQTRASASTADAFTGLAQKEIDARIKELERANKGIEYEAKHSVYSKEHAADERFQVVIIQDKKDPSDQHILFIVTPNNHNGAK